MLDYVIHTSHHYKMDIYFLEFVFGLTKPIPHIDLTKRDSDQTTSLALTHNTIYLIER